MKKIDIFPHIIPKSYFIGRLGGFFCGAHHKG